jgi:hypothetical protein
LGQRRPLRAREEGRRPGSPRGLKEKKKKKGLGRLREKGERRGSEGFSFLFFNYFFQIRFSNFQTSIKQKSMHSNHDAQTLIISKLF